MSGALWKPPPRDERLARTISCPTLRANTGVLAQQAAGKIPGYAGYVPAKDAESVFGGTYAQIGEKSASAAVFRAEERCAKYEHNETLLATKRAAEQRTRSEPRKYDGAVLDGLNGRQTFFNRNYWVPSIPGYAGYRPSVQSENVFGRTYAGINTLAEKAIDLRSTQPVYKNHEDQMTSVFQLYRDIAARPIPGYQGHIPGKEGERIFGFRFPVANRLACEARHHLDLPTWAHP
jgi:hypothetical protein